MSDFALKPDFVLTQQAHFCRHDPRRFYRPPDVDDVLRKAPSAGRHRCRWPTVFTERWFVLRECRGLIRKLTLDDAPARYEMDGRNAIMITSSIIDTGGN